MNITDKTQTKPSDEKDIQTKHSDETDIQSKHSDEIKTYRQITDKINIQTKHSDDITTYRQNTQMYQTYIQNTDEMKYRQNTQANYYKITLIMTKYYLKNKIFQTILLNKTQIIYDKGKIIPD